MQRLLIAKNSIIKLKKGDYGNKNFKINFIRCGKIS